MTIRRLFLISKSTNRQVTLDYCLNKCHSLKSIKCAHRWYFYCNISNLPISKSTSLQKCLQKLLLPRNEHLAAKQTDKNQFLFALRCSSANDTLLTLRSKRGLLPRKTTTPRNYNKPWVEENYAPDVVVAKNTQTSRANNNLRTQLVPAACSQVVQKGKP